MSRSPGPSRLLRARPRESASGSSGTTAAPMRSIANWRLRPGTGAQPEPGNLRGALDLVQERSGCALRALGGRSRHDRVKFGVCVP
jgi:hypothetical protein